MFSAVPKAASLGRAICRTGEAGDRIWGFGSRRQPTPSCLIRKFNVRLERWRHHQFSGLETQVVVYSDSDLLLRPKIPFRGLDRGVPKQKLDLFEIAASLPAQLGAGPAEVMSPKAFNPDLLGGLLNHRPDRPIAQALPFQLPALRDCRRSRPSSIFAAAKPGVHALLDPDVTATSGCDCLCRGDRRSPSGPLASGCPLYIRRPVPFCAGRSRPGATGSAQASPPGTPGAGARQHHLPVPAKACNSSSALAQFRLEWTEATPFRTVALSHSKGPEAVDTSGCDVSESVRCSWSVILECLCLESSTGNRNRIVQLALENLPGWQPSGTPLHGCPRHRAPASRSVRCSSPCTG